jgi:hypothetical protein
MVINFKTVEWGHLFKVSVSVTSTSQDAVSTARILKAQFTLNEWKFNLGFSRVSLLFLNSWRVLACRTHIYGRTLLCDYSPSSYSKTTLTLKGSSD